MRRKSIIICCLLMLFLSACRTREPHAIAEEDVSGMIPETAAQENLPESSFCSQNGYTMHVKSVTSESHIVYVTVQLVAPPEVDLSAFLDRSSGEQLSFQNLIAIPSATNFPADLLYEIADDADGRNNTLDVIFRITSIVPEGGESAFGPGKTCTISFDAILKRGYDRQYEQELQTTKYAGQTGYMLDAEEYQKVYPRTVLAEGPWQFVIPFSAADQEAVQLLREPITVSAAVIRSGETEYDIIEKEELVTITSIRLHPTGLEITFDKPAPAETFDCLYIDANVALMMEDGTEIGFFQAVGAKESAVLRADRPVVLDAVSYLQFSDGTKVPAVMEN